MHVLAVQTIHMHTILYKYYPRKPYADWSLFSLVVNTIYCINY